jgi:hypothetical protein
MRQSMAASIATDPISVATAKAPALMTSVTTFTSAVAVCICFCAMRPAKSLSKKVTA